MTLLRHRYFIFNSFSITAVQFNIKQPGRSLSLTMNGFYAQRNLSFVNSFDGWNTNMSIVMKQA